MEIKNLAQLKRTINERKEFVIRNHRIADFIGQKRMAVKIQTNGFYSAVTNNSEHPLSIENGSKGSWLEYGKASSWEFCGGLCSLYAGEHIPQNLVWTIEFCE